MIRILVVLGHFAVSFRLVGLHGPRSDMFLELSIMIYRQRGRVARAQSYSRVLLTCLPDARHTCFSSGNVDYGLTLEVLPTSRVLIRSCLISRIYLHSSIPKGVFILVYS
jgi:hypothetical protein